MFRSLDTQALIRLWRSREQAAQVAFVNVEVRPKLQSQAGAESAPAPPKPTVLCRMVATRGSLPLSGSPDFFGKEQDSEPGSPAPVPEPLQEEADFFGDGSAVDASPYEPAATPVDEGFDEGVEDEGFQESPGVAAMVHSYAQSAGVLSRADAQGVGSSTGHSIVAHDAQSLFPSSFVDADSVCSVHDARSSFVSPALGAQLDTETEERQSTLLHSDSRSSGSAEVGTEVAEPAWKEAASVVADIGSSALPASYEFSVQQLTESPNVEVPHPCLPLPAAVHAEGQEAISTGAGPSIDDGGSAPVQGTRPTEVPVELPSGTDKTKKPPSGFKLILRRIVRRDRERKPRTAKPAPAHEEGADNATVPTELEANVMRNATSVQGSDAGERRRRAPEKPKSRKRAESPEDADSICGPASSKRCGGRLRPWKSLVKRLKKTENPPDAAASSERADGVETEPRGGAGERRRRAPKKLKLRKKMKRARSPEDASSLRGPTSSEHEESCDGCGRRSRTWKRVVKLNKCKVVKRANPPDAVVSSGKGDDNATDARNMKSELPIPKSPKPVSDPESEVTAPGGSWHGANLSVSKSPAGDRRSVPTIRLTSPDEIAIEDIPDSSMVERIRISEKAYASGAVSGVYKRAAFRMQGALSTYRGGQHPENKPKRIYNRRLKLRRHS